MTILDHGLLNFIPTIDTLRERPPTLDTFQLSDTTVTFWIHETGIREGDISTIEWLDEEGASWFRFEFPATTRDWWYYYFWSFIDRPPSGRWSVNYSLNNQLIIEQTFTVPSASSVDRDNQTTSGISARYLPRDGGILVIETEEMEKLPPTLATIRLYDAMGREVMVLHEGRLRSQSVTIPLAGHGLPAGMYYLHILHNRTSVAFPFPLAE